MAHIATGNMVDRRATFRTNTGFYEDTGSTKSPYAVFRSFELSRNIDRSSYSCRVVVQGSSRAFVTYSFEAVGLLKTRFYGGFQIRLL